MNQHKNEPDVFEIKKYPNRRFYDVTRSRHVTLADLYEIVREGRQIIVQDSKTGADITNVVLTQIILEHDPPKLDLFPASLLHQAIHSNQQMVRSFIDQYLAQAMDAFSRSRQQFDEFLSRSGFSSLSPTAPFDWVRMLIPGPARPPQPPASGAASPNAASRTEPSAVSDASLQDQIAALRAELDEVKRASTNKKKSSSGRSAARKPSKRSR